MADAAIVPKPSIAVRAVTAVADGASTAATVVVGLLPSLNTCLVAVVTAGVTWGGLALHAHYDAPHVVIPAADPPKAVPMVAIGDVDHLLGVHGEKLTADLKAAIKQALDEKFPAPAQKGRLFK